MEISHQDTKELERLEKDLWRDEVRFDLKRLDKIHASRSQKQKLKAEIKQRFGGTCTYCGCTPRFLTLDHIVPQTQGGLNVRSNLAAVCQRCNRSKGSRPLWQWWQASACWNEERAIRFAATVLVCKI
jgi:5-methylcytosine-specific restriction endonuclease McrA